MQNERQDQDVWFELYFRSAPDRVWTWISDHDTREGADGRRDRLSARGTITGEFRVVRRCGLA